MADQKSEDLVILQKISAIHTINTEIIQRIQKKRGAQVRRPTKSGLTYS